MIHMLCRDLRYKWRRIMKGFEASMESVVIAEAQVWICIQKGLPLSHAHTHTQTQTQTQTNNNTSRLICGISVRTSTQTTSSTGIRTPAILAGSGPPSPPTFRLAMRFQSLPSPYHQVIPSTTLTLTLTLTLSLTLIFRCFHRHLIG
jgi:hypothetical protein